MAVIEMTGVVRSVTPTPVASALDTSSTLGGWTYPWGFPIVEPGSANPLQGAFATPPTVAVSAPPSFSASGRIGGFVDDLYYRVHVRPGVLELGNLLSSQTRAIEVWNAHFEGKTLEAIDAEGLDGIVLTQPEVPPTVFGALESRIYQVSISTNGAPTIDGRYVFDFGDEEPTLRITGRRVVLWPFIPQTKFRESLEWQTDLLQAYSSEQRLALRTAPRQRFLYEFQLLPQQYSRAKAISTQWAHRVYGVPVWGELTRLGQLLEGQTSLVFDATSADYRNNDIALVWQDDETFLTIETVGASATGLELKVPLGRSFDNAYVMPLRYARTLNGTEFTRRPDDVTMARLEFLVTNNIDLGASVGLPQYRGKDVLMDRSVTLSDLAEKIVRPVDQFDNGSGPITADPQRGYPDRMETLGLDALSKAEAWRYRTWLHARRGKQKGFWLPGWNRDLLILANVDSAATSITVRPIGYPLYYGVSDIMLVLTDGSVFYNRVLSGSTDTDGNEVLSLGGGFGRSFAASEVDLVCFMRHVRLDTDSVEITHSYAGRCSSTIPVIETPEGF
ncbi:hypothetical protein P9A54_gp34 [Xanthomonas phage vB_Xar_IVIA-DoCa10]|uniref:Virion structural protein n=1 Tax=Xanthomonas phage vB_Xar_IVIA-DoCa10 TaxID=2975529 RepID=A0A9X9JPR9_9CAUD|nr:hypothetical protein P9A54_gp34 [Xanthomonas phage vB_Xar_IVIA-DoCa10]UYA99019.1 hypothetical protein IVIADoCa10_34 [Xanthomonas phage vB_Xar_IVIA-DoCa10]